MYSLIDEPWIIGETADGETARASIRDVFDGTVQLARLQGESPQQDYAVLRVLLAIYWRAHHGDAVVSGGKTFSFQDWFERQWVTIEEGSDPAVLDYLDKYADRFELFDDEKPFMQVAGLRTPKDEVKEISDFIPETGDPYFSMRAGEELDSIAFDEAARWLIYLQAFDFSGIKSGVEGDSRVKGGRSYPVGVGWTGQTGGTVVLGSTLLETLLLNTVQDALIESRDRPVWERGIDGPDVRAKSTALGDVPPAGEYPVGPADLATWQSRRIRLVAEGDHVTGIVLTNGDKIPEAGKNIMEDPMTSYRYSTNKSKKGLDVYYPNRYSAERTMWRSLVPLIVAETDGGFGKKEKAPKRPKNLESLAELSLDFDGIPEVLNVQLLSMVYGSNESVVIGSVSQQMGLPLAVLLEDNEEIRDRVREAASAAEAAAVGLGSFAGNLLVAAGGEYSYQAHPADQLLAALEPQFLSWLRALDVKQSMESQQTAWQRIVRDETLAHATTLLRGAGPKALVGRRVYRSAEDTEGQKISGAVAVARLKRKLDQVLPLTVRKQESEKA
ncbi:type I-E CRISPR-associated protein Cse1/CasA [Corynebacterium camporealensis]